MPVAVTTGAAFAAVHAVGEAVADEPGRLRNISNRCLAGDRRTSGSHGEVFTVQTRGLLIIAARRELVTC